MRRFGWYFYYVIGMYP